MARRRIAFTGLTLGLWLTVSSGLLAHDTHVVGRYRLALGWGDEPAFTGVRNSIVVEVTDAKSGDPITDFEHGSLTTEVSFGTERVRLPLHQVPGGHEFRAWIVPTRAGTFTFHVLGRLNDQPIDITSTCSEKTFDCVVDSTDLQFPAKDPTTGQLAERVERTLPRGEQAQAAAATARNLSLAAVALSALALLAVVVTRAPRARKG